MVHRHETLLFVTPLKHGEFSHPQEGKFVLVSQTETLAHLQTQFAQLLAGLHGIVARKNQDEVARVGLHLLLQGLQVFLSIELIYR